MMKTIVCEEPHRFVLREAPEPEPGKDEALLRVRRIGICGTDLHAYCGNQPFFTYPRVLGHELSGEIAEINSDGTGLRQDDAVVIIPYLACGRCAACRKGRTNCCAVLRLIGIHQDGGMAEYISMPVSHLIRAEGLKLEQMAIVECLSIGAHAVRRAQVQPGQTVLVIGAGPIGMGAMQFARISGARVIALDINDDRLAYCNNALRVDVCLNAGDSDIKGRIAELTDGEFPDVVMEATGNPQSMMNAFKFVAHAGTYVLVSIVKADITFEDPEFHKREITLLSSRNATREDLERVIQAMQRGEVQTDSFITHRVGFDNMIDTFDSWLDPASGVIKAVVEL